MKFVEFIKRSGRRIKEPADADDAVTNAVIEKNRKALAAAIARKKSKPNKNDLSKNDLSKNDLNKKNAAGQTPLAHALSLKDFKAAEMLIYTGADVNWVDPVGFTALHVIVKMSEEYVAAGYQQEEIFVVITKLADKGIAFDRQDRRGNTPISMVAQRATTRPSKGTAELYTQLGKLLLKLDKNASETVQLRNNMGKGPLDYLAKNGNKPLWNAVHDKLQGQDGAESKAVGVQMKWERLVELGKELVG